jgi:hypothetical protein
MEVSLDECLGGTQSENAGVPFASGVWVVIDPEPGTTQFGDGMLGEDLLAGMKLDGHDVKDTSCEVAMLW